MGLFDYKHTKKNIFKNNKINELAENFTEIVTEPNIPVDQDLTTERITNLVFSLNEIFSTKVFSINSSFEDSLVNDIKIFTDNIIELVPGFSGYFTGTAGTNNFNVSGSVLVDALIFLKESLSEDFPGLEKLKESQQLKIGNRDFTVTDKGLIYKNNNLVFDLSSEEHSKIQEIDFKNKKVIFYPGIQIPFYVLFSEESKKTQDSDLDIGASSDAPKENVVSDFVDYSDSVLFERLILKNDNLTDKKIPNIKFSDGDLNFVKLGFLMDTTDAVTGVATYLTSPNSMTNSSEVASYENCISNKINFMYLLLLIILGGGKEGTSPVPWRGQNSYNDNCDRNAYNNWHPMLWSDSSKKGIPFSILQFLFVCLSPFFGINIDEWKIKICIRIKIFRKKIEKCWSWTIFQGWCICGHLEKSILNYQSKISEEIRKMFSCNKVYYKPVYLNEKFIVQQSSTAINSKVYKKNLSELSNSEIETLVSEQGSIIKVIQGY